MLGCIAGQRASLPRREGAPHLGAPLHLGEEAIELHAFGEIDRRQFRDDIAGIVRFRAARNRRSAASLPRVCGAIAARAPRHNVALRTFTA
jgi:hypothetical protein